ncbi:MAG: hypothetical protein KGZ41_07530 [Dethiobacter sp.]|nr:hypothetical protein [Dethiobacter sp.]MBS3983638.1 hypothetical protein [Dethiobacter sp.]
MVLKAAINYSDISLTSKFFGVSDFLCTSQYFIVWGCIFWSKLIYSHETALFLHDLTDRDPINYTVTVPTGYNANNRREEGFIVFSVKRELHQLGTVQMETMFGHRVTAYGLERTICDCIRSRDIAVVTDAVKRYATDDVCERC